MGYPLVDIELQAVNFFTAFEEAVTTYAQYVYQYEIIENMATLEGSPKWSKTKPKVTMIWPLKPLR